MCVDFVLLTCSTAFNILVNISSQARPPKFCCNELADFKEARVSGSFMVMAML